MGKLTEHVFRLAGLAQGMHVLDIGCGTGDVSFLVAKLVGMEGEVIGVDIDSLADRLGEEIVANNATVVTPPFVGAWVRK